MAETPALKTIIVVPSFHYDVAYLKPWRQYLPQSFAILDEALRLLERHAEYRFLVEQVFLLDQYWTQRPEQREPLRRLAQEGRLAVGPGLYVMPDMNHCDGESLYQQARLGIEWLETHLGIQPEVCWIADCWGHHAQLPQILAQCGYRYYVFWRCMRRDVMRTCFMWEGLDGTRIRTHWLARGYGNIMFPSQERLVNAPDLDVVGCGPRDIERICAEVRRFDPQPVAMLCNNGDFMMPQASAADVVRQLNASGQLPPLVFGTPGDILGRLDWDQAPVVGGEFNSALQGTFTSNIRIKQRNRELVERLLAVEALQVAAGLPPRDLGAAWRGVLKQQFHDIICGTITDDAVRDALAEFDAVGAELDAAVDALGPAQGVPAAFNPAGFARVETVEHAGHRWRLALPAFGFGALDEAAALPGPADAALPAVFENAWYAARIDAQGYIASLRDRSSGTELADTARVPFGGLGLQMDYGDYWLNFEAPLSGGSLESSLTQDTPDPYDRSRPGEIVNRGTFGAQVQSVRAERRGDDELWIEQSGCVSFWSVYVRFTTRLRLSAASPRIEYETRIEPAGKHYRLRAAFPTTLAGGRILHEVPFGVQERGPYEHVAQRWAACVGEQAGVAVLNAGTPANTVDDGMLMLTLFRSVAMEYKAPSELGFQQGVPHTFRYAVMPFAAGAEAGVVREALAFNRPPVLCRAMQRQCGIDSWRIEGDAHVLISSLRWAGPCVFVRVYCATKAQGTATLRVPAGFKAWAPADGLERATGSFSPLHGGLPLALGPFEVRGFLLRG